jgi:hypothetical protein
MAVPAPAAADLIQKGRPTWSDFDTKRRELFVANLIAGQNIR